MSRGERARGGMIYQGREAKGDERTGVVIVELDKFGENSSRENGGDDDQGNEIGTAAPVLLSQNENNGDDG